MSTDAQQPSEPLNRPSGDPKSLLVLIPDRIDIEEEARFYEDLCDSAITDSSACPSPSGLESPPFITKDNNKETHSVFSREIWLGDNSGESLGFARDVEIVGWTSVGDKRNGAYVVYDCAIKTKEGTVIHIHKRYSAFAHLYAKLRTSLPESQRSFVPPLPPKTPLAKFRPSFLDQRRRLLQHWLSSVLLHPDIGGCQAVREWVMD